MNIPASAVPAARLALLGLLETALGTKNLQVCLDEPMQAQADDIVSVGNATNNVEFLAMIGDLDGGALQETFVLEVVCESYRGGDNASPCFAAAAANADKVMSSVRQNPTLNGTVNVECVPIGVVYESSIAYDESENATGRITRATVAVRCNSTL